LQRAFSYANHFAFYGTACRNATGAAYDATLLVVNTYGTTLWRPAYVACDTRPACHTATLRTSERQHTFTAARAFWLAIKSSAARYVAFSLYLRVLTDFAAHNTLGGKICLRWRAAFHS